MASQWPLVASQWPLVLFAVFMTLAGGTYVVSVVLSEWMGLAKHTRKAAMALVAAALIIGGVASMSNLGYLERIFGVFSNPTSGIFVEGSCSMALVLIVVIYVVALSRNGHAATLKIIGTIGLVPAVILVVSVGAAYLMPGRPAWNTAVLPLVSADAAFLSGCLVVWGLKELLSKVGSVENDKESKGSRILKTATMVAAAAMVILVSVYLFTVANAPYQDVSRSIARLLNGDMALLFWGGVVGVGIAIPVVVAFVAKRGNGVLPLVGAACVVLGAIAFRCMMLMLGSSIVTFGF